jgi:hypothetical protein
MLLRPRPFDELSRSLEVQVVGGDSGLMGGEPTEGPEGSEVEAQLLVGAGLSMDIPRIDISSSIVNNPPDARM